MARNLYFSDAVRSEQELYENIIIESLKMYGQDVYYLPRDLVNEDKIFGDDVSSRFNSSYKVEMYVENIDGFDGEGDLFTKFGVEIRDQATFVIARRRWSDTVTKYDNEITGTRPREGDLIYLPMSKSMFQIMAVEHEQPFYQLRDLPTYKLRCELFEYTGEDFDTDVDGIDAIEKDFAYRYNIDFQLNTADVSTSLSNGEVVSPLTINQYGSGYTDAPIASITNQPAVNTFKFGTNSLYPNNSNTTYNLTSYSGQFTSAAGNSRGFIDFWVYLDSLPASDTFMQLAEIGSAITIDAVTTTKIVFVVDDLGRLNFYSPQASNVGFGTLENQTDDFRLTTGTWHHIRFAVRGGETGASSRLLQVYIDGNIVHRDQALNRHTFSGDFKVGGTSQGVDLLDNATTYELLDGYIDEFYSSNSNLPIIDVITIPTSAYAGTELNTIAFENFNTNSLTVTSSITSDGLLDAVVVDQETNHKYFVNPPTVQLTAPTELSYQPGETVTQVLSSAVTLTGEVSTWKTSTNEMTVIQVSASDGKYHEFVNTKALAGSSSGVSVIPLQIAETNTMSANEDNDDFESEADDILDFTETNPFGDPNEA